jgi:hypothetical protein
MAAVALGMMALSALLLSDVPNIYDGLIRGDKFRWLLALHPFARASLMGGLGAFILIVAVYLLLWVLYAKPVKISQEGVEAYPWIFRRSHTGWDDVDQLSVDNTYVVLKLKPRSGSASTVRIPVRLARSAQEILDHIARHRPDLVSRVSK